MLAATYARGDADHVLVTTGAIEANFLLFNVLLDAGRSRHRAVSGLSAALQRAARDRLRRVALARRTGDRLSLRPRRARAAASRRRPASSSSTRRTIRPARCCRRSDAQRVYALAESVGATVIGDEAYRWLAVPDGEPFAPPMFDLGERGISVGTLSKPFGLPGLRIGWIAGAAGSRAAVLGDARLHLAQSGQAERRAGVPGDDAPRPDRRAQPRRSSRRTSATARQWMADRADVPQLDAAARRPARAAQVRPADRLARRSPTSSRSSTA